MRIVILVSLLFLCACGTSPSSTKEVQTDHKLDVMHSREEVSAQIRRVYYEVLDRLTHRYFSAYPELDTIHTQAMREFILRESPPESFVSMRMEQLDESQNSERATTDGPRQNQEFNEVEYRLCITKSDRLAEKFIEPTREVYVAKFVNKNPLILELLSMDPDHEYTGWIADVYGEVTHQQFSEKCRVDMGGYEYRDGDRFFGFCSSQKSWDNLCGNQGFLIVRDGKILQGIVTMMN